jgi:hypothetical protein
MHPPTLLTQPCAPAVPRCHDPQIHFGILVSTPTAVHAIPRHPGTSRLSHSSRQAPRTSTVLRFDSGAQRRLPSAGEDSSMGKLKGKAQARPHYIHPVQAAASGKGIVSSTTGPVAAWASAAGGSMTRSATQSPLYNRHACTVVEDLISTPEATIRAHKSHLRAKSARPYMNVARPH